MGRWQVLLQLPVWCILEYNCTVILKIKLARFLWPMVYDDFDFYLCVNFCSKYILLWQTKLPEDVNIIPHQCLHNLELVAEGGFGMVFRAEHEDWGTVAYKELKTNIIPQESRSVTCRVINTQPVSVALKYICRPHVFSLSCEILPASEQQELKNTMMNWWYESSLRNLNVN